MQTQTDAPRVTAPSGLDRTSHLVVGAVCLGILLGARTLTMAGSDIRIGPINLPGLCVLRQTTGIPCPGCGLTRAVVAAVHGDWNLSFAQHRLGPLVVLFLGLQAAYRFAWLGLPSWRTIIASAGRFLDWALVPLMVLLFINWIPTLAQTLRPAN